MKQLRKPLWKKLPTWVSCEAGPELTQTRKGAVKGWGDSPHCKPSGSKSHRALLPVDWSQSWLRWRGNPLGRTPALPQCLSCSRVPLCVQHVLLLSTPPREEKDETAGCKYKPLPLHGSIPPGASGSWENGCELRWGRGVTTGQVWVQRLHRKVKQSCWQLNWMLGIFHTVEHATKQCV